MPKSPRLCGSPGCGKPDHHEGLCAGDASDAFHVRRRREPALASSPCQPCVKAEDDLEGDDDFEVKPPKRGSQSGVRTAVKPTSQKKRRVKRQREESEEESEYVPSGSEADGDDDDDNDDDDSDDDDDEDASGANKAPSRSKATSRQPKSSAPAKPPRQAKAKAPRKGVGTAAATAGTSPAAAKPDGEAESPDGAVDEAAVLMAQLYDSSNHTGNYVAELAKTGRAKCRVCGEVIAHKELRIGVEADEKGWGVITRWHHVACARLPSTVEAAQVGGYAELCAGDRERVEAMLSATGLPEHLKPVEPDAEVEAAASSWTKQREPPETLLAPSAPAGLRPPPSAAALSAARARRA